MKKLIFTLLIGAIVAGGAFALDMSAGGGATFAAHFQKYNLSNEGSKYVKDLMGQDEDIFDSNRIGISGFGFFDVTYAMATVGVTYLDVSWVNKDRKKADKDITTTVTYLDIGLYGKYPIDLGGATLFPLLGVDFSLCTKMAEKNKSKTETINSPMSKYTNLWLKFGVGADIPLAEKIYLRPMFTYGFGTNTDEEKKALKSDYFDSIVNHGLDLSLAVGFKF